MREGATSVFLAHLLRLCSDIETLLPQFSGLALTVEQLRSLGADAPGDSSDGLLLADTMRVSGELDEAFTRLRAFVKRLAALRLPDEVPTLRRVVAIISSYVFTFFSDNLLLYKQMKTKLQVEGACEC